MNEDNPGASKYPRARHENSFQNDRRNPTFLGASAPRESGELKRRFYQHQDSIDDYSEGNSKRNRF